MKSTGYDSSSFLFLLMMMAVFYLMLIRPQAKRAKAHRQMLSTLAKGDEVCLNSGMYGKISKVAKKVIEVELAKNMVITVKSSAIEQVLPKGSLAILQKEPESA